MTDNPGHQAPSYRALATAGSRPVARVLAGFGELGANLASPRGLLSMGGMDGADGLHVPPATEAPTLHWPRFSRLRVFTV